MKTVRRQSAFTLIEIVMVIAIIAILAALALPSRLGEITQKRLIETLELVEHYKPLIENYYYSHAGEFPDDNDAAGLPEPNKILGNYLEKVEVRAGAMHLYLGQKLPENLHNEIVTLRPVFVKDSVDSRISWICGYDKKPSGMEAAGVNLTSVEKVFLPGRCR